MLSLIRGQGLRALVLGNTGGVRNVEIRLGGLLLVFGDGCVPHDTCAVGLHGRSLPEVAFGRTWGMPRCLHSDQLH